MKENNIPEFRFSGFTHEWEQKKMGDIGSVSMCKRIYKDQTSESGQIPFYKIGTFGRTPNSFISRELFDEYRNKYPYPEIGDVLISASGTIGRTVVYNGEDAYYQDSNIIWLKRNKELVVNSFLQQFYQIVQWAGIEGTTIKRLYNNNILSTKIFLPTLKEQIKIGNFLKKIDETISLQQQELDNLKQTKQGFLQKMFPKEGKCFPKIRFSGFIDDWKQCKLKDIAEFNPKTNLPEEFEYVDLESILGINLVSHRTENKETAPSRAQRLAKRGDVFFQTVRPYQKNNYLFDLPFDNYVFSTGYAQMRPYIHSYFLLSRLQEEKFVSNVLNRSTGTSYPAINSKNLAEIQISIPKSKEEQTKIGNLFKQLDATINLHQKELDALQETKKAFLQKMFV